MKLCIFGATGSIGSQALDICRQYPDDFELVGVSAYKNIKKLKAIIQEFRPPYVAVPTAACLPELVIPGYTPVYLIGPVAGADMGAVSGADRVILAVSGTAGLLPCERSIRARIPVALACKEVLVAAGDLITALAKDYQVPLIPIDSEHVAIHQCLAYCNYDASRVAQMTLTASGGPFLNQPDRDLSQVTPEQAIQHPKWSMGQKISVDSATLMNKGLEIIEAHYLFHVPYAKLTAIIHPQSLVHSLVQFTDGTTLAQLGQPDMHLPIRYAMTYPDYLADQTRVGLDLTACEALSFQPIDMQQFPLFKLALEAGRQGMPATTVLTAANECAVQLFLSGYIVLSQVYPIVYNALETWQSNTLDSIAAVCDLDTDIKQAINARYKV